MFYFILIDFILSILICFIFKKRGIIFCYVFHIILTQMFLTYNFQIFSIVCNVGSIFYAILFMFIDFMNEFYHKKEANKLVNYGIITLSVLLILIMTINVTKTDFFDINTEQMIKTIICDIIVSYLIFQNLKILIFSFFKKLFSSKYVFFRSLTSTAVCQFLIAVIFYELIFFNYYSQDIIVSIIFSGLTIKMFIAFLSAMMCSIFKKIWNRKNIHNNCAGVFN